LRGGAAAVGILAVLIAVRPVAARAQRPACAADNAGLTLPPGFCANIWAADSLGQPRHIVVAPNGDVFAASRTGELVGTRDTDGDGRADVVRRTRVGRTGSGIAMVNGYLYFATDEAVVRWRWPAGALEPPGPPDTIVAGMVSGRQHSAKTIAVTRDGALFVNIGAPSNACQERDRQAGSPGIDPCPLLDSAGGIWRFDANRRGQREADGHRWSSGLRNVVSLALDASERPFGVQHGRDQLGQLFPSLYNDTANAEKPAEELFLFEDGVNYGWPYCYYDPALRRKVLAPEYGGDGQAQGRCVDAPTPLVAFPAHWAPDGALAYTGTQFPAAYRGGAFVAFHGSWNRAPMPQQGYNVTFVPFRGGRPVGTFTVFARGFQSAEGRAIARPTGLALGPDGSLFVSDDFGGRIYRIRYTGR
jgi:glucose/arabinose dehydrogenase